MRRSCSPGLLALPALCLPAALRAQAPAADPLSQLRELHLPEAPGVWPPAPGWYLLLLAVLILLAGGAWLWHRGRAQRRLRRAVRAELAALERQIGQGDDAAFLARISALLRRLAVQLHGPGCAGLYGKAWRDYLRTAAPAGINAEFLQLLSEQRFQPQVQVADRAAVLQAVGNWFAQASKQPAPERPC